MNLLNILVLAVAALFTGWAIPPRGRPVVILFSSLLAIFWLQPSTPIRNLDFWLPTTSLVLVVFVWAAVQTSPGGTVWQASWPAGMLLLGGVMFVGLLRYTGPVCCLTPSRPPALHSVAAAVAIGSLVAAAPSRLWPEKRIFPGLAIGILLGLFLVLKTEMLAQPASTLLRTAVGQSTGLASALDLRWLGFSYLAFRLLHVLRDVQAGKLQASGYSLSEFVSYALFFPVFPAGPIDRFQHFTAELRQSTKLDRAAQLDDLALGARRLLLGLFKKFALADSLALLALNDANAAQVHSPAWMWLLLYAYALRIYFDFSGYTDIALGLARWMHIRLPENFSRPYLKQNLTAFWNSWHITLAQWFRAYFFNPFTRFLRTSQPGLPAWVVILVTQLATMVLIGLWHGITWNFAAWGAWHGLGLFLHNRWLAWARPQLAWLDQRPRLRFALNAAGWFLTFHYVVFGWVWFALSDLRLAGSVFARLLGG